MFNLRFLAGGKGFAWLTVSVVLMFLLTACNFGATPPPASQTAGQLPDMTGKGYNQYNGEEVWKAGTDASGVFQFFKAQPQLAATVAVVSNLGTCAQKEGIANWRVYARQQDATAAGVILVVSQARLTNPGVILNCLRGGSMSPSMSPNSNLSPCSNNYSYTTASDTYHVFYAATKEAVCEDFRAALPK